MLRKRILLVVFALIGSSTAWGCTGKTLSSWTASPLPTAPSGVTPLPRGVLPQPPARAPLPRPGLAAISGVLYSFTISQAIAGTEVYLTPVGSAVEQGQPKLLTGPHPEAGDVVARSGPDGEFVIVDIPPGGYYMVVWAPYSWSVAQNSATDSSPLYIRVVADQSLPLGVVYLSWP